MTTVPAPVGSAGAGVPGIEMRTQHDDFIFLVGAGDFGDGVVLHGIVVVKGAGDVQFERDVLFLLQQAGDARPVLGSHGELGNRCSLACLVGAAGLNEYGATAGGAAAVVNHGKHFFVGEELVQVFDELAAFRDLCHTKRRTFARNLIFADLGKVIITETLVGSFRDGLHFGFRAQDHDHSCELAAIFVEVFFFFNVGAYAFAADDAVGARGPRFGVHEERNNIGRGHAGVDVLIGPSAAEGAPGFKVGVAQAHRGQLVAGPLTGALHVGGSGESFPDRVH
jgi:hypothetical protein